MDRRTFGAAAAAALLVGASGKAFGATDKASGAANEDIQPGCEGAVAALKGWIVALKNRNFEYLEQHLAPDFAFSYAPLRTKNGMLQGGHRNKAQFIEQDRHIYNSDIKFVSLTARKMGDLVVTLVFATVFEEVRGDLGPGMPSAAEMNAVVQNKTLAYASGWRKIDGRWQCTSHNVLGDVQGA